MKYEVISRFEYNEKQYVNMVEINEFDSDEESICKLRNLLNTQKTMFKAIK